MSSERDESIARRCAAALFSHGPVSQQDTASGITDPEQPSNYVAREGRNPRSPRGNDDHIAREFVRDIFGP